METPLEVEMTLHRVAAVLAVSLAIVSLCNSLAHIVAEFAHGKADPVEAGKKGGQK